VHLAGDGKPETANRSPRSRLNRWGQHPSDLAAADAHLGEAVTGGTAQLFRQLVFRPVTGLGGPRTPIDGISLTRRSTREGGARLVGLPRRAGGPRRRARVGADGRVGTTVGSAPDRLLSHAVVRGQAPSSVGWLSSEATVTWVASATTSSSRPVRSNARR